MQAAVLPPAYGEAFSTLFDEAPQISYDDVIAVFQRDFGKRPEEIFDEFETTARASASIASVFKARLKSGEWVAVKVQKPEIEKQVQVSDLMVYTECQWDLFAYRVLMYIYDRWLFKIPVYFTVDYISKHLLAETDFVKEAQNGARMRYYIEKEPLLRDKVLIPWVHSGILSPRVMVAEVLNRCCVSEHLVDRWIADNET
jgi:aarF domain-containing kinase